MQMILAGFVISIGNEIFISPLTSSLDLVLIIVHCIFRFSFDTKLMGKSIEHKYIQKL